MVGSNLYWIAGLLEGEGCFYYNPKRRSKGSYMWIKLAMTDKDVIERAASIMNCNIQGPYTRVGTTHKPVYVATLYGRYAVAWMMTLYTLMGERRKETIKEILLHFKSTPVLSNRIRKRKESIEDGTPVSQNNSR